MAGHAVVARVGVGVGFVVAGESYAEGAGFVFDEGAEFAVFLVPVVDGI